MESWGIGTLLAAAVVSRTYRLDLVEKPDSATSALFFRSFGSPPPNIPLHFVARTRNTGHPVGYVHYTQHAPGVYLCGGLCVDPRSYRALSPLQRACLRRIGSLSRWLLNESIKRLDAKRAVFAYTGNEMSRRDGFASRFEPTDDTYLIVQWHEEPLERRPALVRDIAGLGAF